MDTNFISLGLSIISLIVSCIAALIIWRFNNVTLRNSSRQEHHRIMLEIDKILIDNPELWAVYDDTHAIAGPLKKDDTPALKAQRCAFIYYYINFFDTLYDYYHRQITKNKNDKQDWLAWKDFMEHYFKGSTEARELTKKSFTLFDGDFAKFLLGLIDEIEEEMNAVEKVDKDKVAV